MEFCVFWHATTHTAVTLSAWGDVEQLGLSIYIWKYTQPLLILTATFSESEKNFVDLSNSNIII
jgi:hypothetical protein